MADAYYRVSHEVIPVYTSTGPGPMLLTAAVANAFYDSSALIAITGQVATTQYDSGALQEEYRYFQSDYPEHREGDHEAELPGPLRRGPRQVPAEGVQARARGTPRPGPHRRAVRPLGDEGGRRGARSRGALAAAQLAHARLARGGGQGARAAARRAAAADPRRRRSRLLRGQRAARGVRRARERPRLHELHGQGRALGPAPAPPRDRRLLGRVPGPGGGAERGRDPRARLPLLRHPQLVVAARLHVQHPADQADPRRHRSAGDRPELPDRARHRRRRPRGAEAAAGARRAAGPEARPVTVARPGRGVQGGVVELHRAGEGVRRRPDRPAARDQGAARRPRRTTR